MPIDSSFHWGVPPRIRQYRRSGFNVIYLHCTFVVQSLLIAEPWLFCKLLLTWTMHQFFIMSLFYSISHIFCSRWNSICCIKNQTEWVLTFPTSYSRELRSGTFQGKWVNDIDSTVVNSRNLVPYNQNTLKMHYIHPLNKGSYVCREVVDCSSSFLLQSVLPNLYLPCQVTEAEWWHALNEFKNTVEKSVTQS